MREFNMAIVGLGGVGGIIADNMFAFTRSTIFDWGLKNLLFVDRDTYSQRNIPRQKAAGRMLGRNKAVAWRDIYMSSKYNRSGVKFLAEQEWVTNETVTSIFQPLRNGFPLVIMACVDNHPARLVMSRWVGSLMESNSSPVVVIQGGCAGTYATADLYGRWLDPDYLYVKVGRPIEEGHPEILTDSTGDRGTISCEELANSPEGDQTFAENFMSASMMMNILFTLLTPNGPEVLSKLKGEMMEVTMHYHNIEKDIKTDSDEPEETSEEEQPQEEQPQEDNPGFPEEVNEDDTEEEEDNDSGESAAGADPGEPVPIREEIVADSGVRQPASVSYAQTGAGGWAEAERYAVSHS